MMKALFLTIFVLGTISAQSNPFAIRSSVMSIPNTQYGNHGVAVIDFDKDGFEDIFFANIAQTGGIDTSWCLLLKNNFGENFSNVTTAAGLRSYGSYKCGVWGDVNNDNYPDLFLAESYGQGGCHLFINNKNGTFNDVILSCGIDFTSTVSTAAFGDYDEDGKIDLFLATDYPQFDLLYHNTSVGDSISFQDVSSAAGVGGLPGTAAMQTTFFDYDRDGDLDIYNVHDGFQESNLFRNNGNGTFSDVSVQTGLNDFGAGNSMGVYWKDFDFDGWEEVYVTRIGKGGLYKRQMNGTYRNVADSLGAEFNGMSWGIVWEDFDNDMDDDIFTVNTYGYNGVKSLYFENSNGKYIEKAFQYGINFPYAFYGLAYGDFNNDGYLDLVASATDGNNTLLMNTKNKTGNWIKLLLTGTTINKMAVGAKARVVAGGRSQVRTVTAGNSYASQMSTFLHFGLNAVPKIDTLEITWSKNSIQVFTGITVNNNYRLTEGGSLVTSISSSNNEQIPEKFLLEQNYPNPFNPTTTIAYHIPNPEVVSITIWDLLGRIVYSVVNRVNEKGKYHFSFDASTLSSGIYMYRLQAGNFVQTRKMVYLR